MERGGQRVTAVRHMHTHVCLCGLDSFSMLKQCESDIASHPLHNHPLLDKLLDKCTHTHTHASTHRLVHVAARQVS